MINPLRWLFVRRHSALLGAKFFVLEQTTARMSAAEQTGSSLRSSKERSIRAAYGHATYSGRTPMALQSHLLVEDVMGRWPATIRVFLDFKLSCVGCPIAGFHDIDDACREHGIDRDAFLAALMKAAV
jgi:hybrid cluster-associated redox disulfide protein